VKNPLREYGLFGWNYLHLMTHPWLLPKEWWYHTKWFLQRGWRGWADCDAWSIDYYISRIVLEMMEAQYVDSMGIPGVLFVEQDLDQDGNPTKEACDRRHAEWLAILSDIREGFRAHRAIQDFDFWDSSDVSGSLVEQKELQSIADRGLQLFAKYFGSLWN
jgi:hypothetical protein